MAVWQTLSKTVMTGLSALFFLNHLGKLVHAISFVTAVRGQYDVIMMSLYCHSDFVVNPSLFIFREFSDEPT